MYSLSGRIILLLLLMGLASCSHKKELELQKTLASKELKYAADQINEDFIHIRHEVKVLAEKISLLYDPITAEKTLERVDKSKYQVHQNGVLYKPENDGGSAVFVSGYYPLTGDILNIVYFTEPMDQYFKDIIQKFPSVVQAYYNDKHSYNRIYPYFDVITQYEPKMEIPIFNFYYLADADHNPARDALWVNEPYVDPAGRGWMVSAIAPVYVNDQLEGVPGLDVTINTITDRYITQDLEDFAILDSKGAIVSVQDYLVTLFSLPMLRNHKYLETIKQNTYLADDYNLLKSKSKDVRNLAERIFYDGMSEIPFNKGDVSYLVLVETIEELDWKILKVIHL